MNFILEIKDRPTVEEITFILSKLTVEEQQQILAIIQGTMLGLHFAKSRGMPNKETA